MTAPTEPAIVEPAIVEAATDADVRACWPAMHELRPHLADADELVARWRTQRAEGYRLWYVEDAGVALAAAGFRLQHNLAWGRVLYVDDLVTLSAARRAGHAARLLDAIYAEAQRLDCQAVHLDSGHARHAAHRLYLHSHFVLDCHHFARAVTAATAAE